MREAVRADVAAIYGPDVMHDALETPEARSYLAARAEAEADMAAFAERVKRNADEFASKLSGLLPEGFSFGYELRQESIVTPEFSFSGPPCLVPPALIDEIRVSEAELAEFAAEWRRRFQATGRHDRVRLLTPLPRRTRLKLAIHRHVTTIGCWLGDHVSWDATERLWRALGLLGRRRR